MVVKVHHNYIIVVDQSIRYILRTQNFSLVGPVVGTYGNSVAIVLTDDPTQATDVLTANATNLHGPLALIQGYP